MNRLRGVCSLCVCVFVCVYVYVCVCVCVRVRTHTCVLRLDAALDLEILATEDFTGDYFLQEIRGLADASGVDYKVYM